MQKEKKNTPKKRGCLYSGIKISARAADALVALSCGALALCLFAAISLA